MDKLSLIEKYFEGTLSSIEREEFDSLINTDSEFKKDFEFQSNLQKAIHQNEREELKKELQDLEFDITNKVKKKSAFPLLKVAASIVLIFSLGAYFLLNNPASSEDLFREYYSPYENVVQPIVRGESSETIEFKAFLSYEKQEYNEALTLFESAYNNTQKSHLLLYKANCLLSLQQPEQAISALNEYLTKEEIFKDKANWYLGLSYLQLNSKEQAKKYFKNVQELSKYKSKEIEELLNKL
ncbi:tetratricopeptide repeat protein [Tenacibaculum jejuense]|uniref:Tetratricopeptide repeat protein n=1 Tax=Tenacibaculum jejuense TaxID=584609 RepID=A0A238UEU5_9FLAO|nr:tetratricopeptide repeat protein [Tenacibaculum jejuense]SNR17681.1 conserved protein of unknown function [Tenacibaculum jejuense]